MTRCGTRLQELPLKPYRLKSKKCLAHASIAVRHTTAIATKAHTKCTSTVMIICIASTAAPAVMVIAAAVHLKFTSTGAQTTNAFIVA